MRTKPVPAIGLAMLVMISHAAAATVRDVPFGQAVSVRFEHSRDLEGAQFRRLALQRDGLVYVLTDRGVARTFGDRVALDRSFRPLQGKLALDLTVQHGNLFYLFDDSLLSNDLAGRYHLALPTKAYRRGAVLPDGTALLAGPTNLLVVAGTNWAVVPFAGARESESLYATENQFLVLAGDTIYRLRGPTAELLHRGDKLTTLALRANELLVGTHHGYYALDLPTGRTIVPLQDRLPGTDVTCLCPTTSGLWVGTTKGVFFQGGSNAFRYYASKRWLPDDFVVDVQADADGQVFVLTKGGLGRIEFRSITLEQKAQYYEKKIRERHMRYGFCAELRMTQPGDATTAEMIDTDNDGMWSSGYLASQAFRYAATGEEPARARAWETFDALERLQTINGLEGFPSRSFERTGFKVSDPERWHTAPERHWEWKAHTSSDEITAQTFAYAVLYEAAARTPAEKARIATAYDRIIGHIVRNNYYLVDLNGQPTLWGRWNPEYVNHYPPSIVDRRLNSAEIIAFLQFAYHLTGNPLYREKAADLIDHHGYLRNITNSMAAIRPTPGYEFRGHDMGNEWNHSDDTLAFYTYWTLYRYAFDDQLRQTYAAAIRDHWEVEKIERNPVWNFVYALTGAPQFDGEGALWTLRNFPLDLVDWTIQNSHRRDLSRLPANFRQQETAELLPPDERPVMRWNGNPFTLDGGSGGLRELAGDEFLLPYWMGRYLRIIQ